MDGVYYLLLEGKNEYSWSGLIPILYTEGTTDCNFACTVGTIQWMVPPTERLGAMFGANSV